MLSASDATAVLESIYRISKQRMNNTPGLTTGLTADQVVKDLVNCGYLKAADVADRFGNTVLDPGKDPLIVGPTGIFTDAEWNSGGTDQQEFRKTASIMKLVVEGFAGAGCIEMGGYDYHGGMRQEGEVKDFRAGKCMGAVLEFAARKGVPLMMYVFSDGSLSSDGAIDNSVNGRGKGEWMSDNQDAASPFFLVYNPGHRPQIFTGSDGLTRRAAPAARRVQRGRQRDARRDAGREQREPARRDRAAELHGAAPASKACSARSSRATASATRRASTG